MSDYRDLILLRYYDQDQEMAVAIIDQHRSRVVMTADGPEPYSTEVSDRLFWPAFEMPVKDLLLDEWYNSPVLNDIYERYRACMNLVEKGVDEDGDWRWKQEWYCLGIAGHGSAEGYPLPTPELTDKALAMVRNYTDFYRARHEAVKYGPETVDDELLATLNRGLPAEYSRSWDPPRRSDEAPAEREVFIIQGQGDHLAIFLRGYARVGKGPLFEMFAPIEELKEHELGRHDQAKYRTILNHVSRYGATGAKWVALSNTDEWLSSTVVKRKPESGFNNSPRPVTLMHTAEAVQDYLKWRATAYGQPISLLTEITKDRLETLPFIAGPEPQLGQS